MNKQNFIIELAVDELKNKRIGFTAQFLEVHELVYENNKPVIVKIADNKKDGTATIYFKVVKAKFYFVLYFNIESEIQLLGSDTHPYFSIALKADSTTLSLNELAALSKLKYSIGKNKGDKKVQGSSDEWRESRIIYEPFLDPDDFENKLENLLNYLETDKEGVIKLADNARGHIGIAIEYYIGNTMLGGPTVKKDLMNRISNLNLDIDFDLYVSGIPFK
jgi:Domain of unknown function (DUF4279)